MEDKRVPLTLLTGFLGAGKTTLLNTVLADTSAGRVAVIVNEFGEAGLDHDLIEQSSEEIILMQSGCLCCSIRGDLSNTISSLIGRKNRKEIEFDRLLIETTGLADPGPITQTLLVDAISLREQLGSCVVVDCRFSLADPGAGRRDSTGLNGAAWGMDVEVDEETGAIKKRRSRRGPGRRSPRGSRDAGRGRETRTWDPGVGARRPPAHGARLVRGAPELERMERAVELARARRDRRAVVAPPRRPERRRQRTPRGIT